MQTLQYDTTRSLVITPRGEELPIKEHNGWRYVNYNGTKIGVSKIAVVQPPNDDAVFDYIFKGLSVSYPCPAMEYFIYRHRLGIKISPINYKIKFKVKQK